ncbi:MAG: RNA polymerase sigma factor [Prevotella sp.]
MQITQTILLDFRRGDIGSFYKEAYPSLLRYAVRFLGNEMAYMGEDCVADAIFKAYQSREQFSTPMELKAFLFTCVHNEVVSLFRKNQRHRRYVSLQRDIEVEFIDNIVMQETLDRLQSAIDQLPPRLREIFTMTYEMGMRRGDIAEQLQVSEATVKRDRQKIISILREEFKDDILAKLIIALAINATI